MEWVMTIKKKRNSEKACKSLQMNGHKVLDLSVVIQTARSIHLS